MPAREGPKAGESLELMEALEGRLREQADRLEHLRLSATELKENMAAQNSIDLKMSIADHLDWLARLSERMETLQMSTAVFVQMNTKPRTWGSTQGSKRYGRRPRPPFGDDAQSEFGWSPARTRRNSDAASELSCAW